MNPFSGVRNRAVLSALCLVGALYGCGRPDQAASPFEEIIEAERSFSRSSAVHGMKAAFLAYLAEDGIVFRPRPVNGRAWYTAAPETDAVLTWAPAAGDVSSTGDLGYTTGPWEMRDVVSETTYFGTYVSVWRKEGDGSWRVVADAGTVHPETPSPEGTVARPVRSDDGSDASRARGGAQSGADDMETAARDFCRVGGEAGADSAFARFAAPEVRLLRPGATPVVGREAAARALGGVKSPVECRRSGAAASGDLGYVFGTRRWVAGDDPAASNPEGAVESYLQIWTRSAVGWRIAVEVAVPVVEPDSSAAD